MSMMPCPGCGLPRLADEVARVSCPLCGAYDRALPAEPIALIVEAEPVALTPAPSHFPWRGSLIAILGFSAGIAATLGWQHSNPLLVTENTTPAEVAAAPSSSTPTTPAPSTTAPVPVTMVPTPSTAPTVKPAPGKTPSTSSVLPGRGVVHLTQPNQIYTTPPLRAGETLTLKGQAKALHVAALDQEAVLDATELDVDEVIVHGDITGRSRLKARAPLGSIDIKGRVTGGSTLDLVGKKVSFRDDLVGLLTRVNVVLSQGGTLNFADLIDGAELHYRRARPWDATPRVIGGKIDSDSHLKGDE